MLCDKKIMLDRDLAELYGVRSIRLREQVKRNLKRFLVKFYVSQLGGYLPYAFTEHGVLMLANILRSEKAIRMSIRIIEIFVKLREMSLTHKDILLKLEILEKEAIMKKIST